MPLKTTRFDAADYIETPADVAGFLALAFADIDPDEIRDAIAVVARSRGTATLAAKAKLNPKSLYRTLGPNGNPEFATVLQHPPGARHYAHANRQAIALALLAQGRVIVRPNLPNFGKSCRRPAPAPR